ncbi:Aste57867_12558 [Aphanomyces stellatus]|uniref:Aste57867_12558 protein n=1 Tax=Aphanomyces stellatus TaxID=120398 RepID=A0A485KVX1_9STRA|nr:hypothetical protein As57867_012512 [Aphanomyces stellatus]VFT89409.1 Aste57867_12558 [Aphanomyces stellatus]
MVGTTRGVLVFVLGIGYASSECAYNDWTADAIQTFNKHTQSFEIVDRNCTTLANTTKFQAVGDISNFNGTTLNYTDRPELIDLVEMIPSWDVTELILDNVGATSLQGMISYRSISKLTLKDMTLDTFPSSAAPLVHAELILVNLTLVNVSSLQNLRPPSISISGMNNFVLQDLSWPMLTSFSLTNLTGMSMSNVEFQGVKILDFENVSIQSITDLHLHELNIVTVQTSNISNWAMDNVTFDVLERVNNTYKMNIIPIDTVKIVNLSNISVQPSANFNLGGSSTRAFLSSNVSKTTMGNISSNFIYELFEPVKLDTSSFVTVSQAYCTNIGGIVRTLWPSSGKKYTVCVRTAKVTNMGLILGLSIGGVILLAMVAIILWRKNPSIIKDKYQQVHSPIGYINANGENSINIQALDVVRIEVKDVMLDKVLGTGAFADVWLGSYCGEPVAVKQLHANNATITQLQSFVDEIILMSEFDSPRIVKLIGACWTRPRTLKCVMELMDGGDLRSYLVNHCPDEFTWPDKFLHIFSIVEGLVYLHSMNVIHRDMKSRNILLDSTKGTKLTDFGISKEDEQQTMTMGVGTLRWMAPEIILEKHYTVAADIYSFGMVLSEFDSHQIPFHDLTNPITGQLVSELGISNKVAAGELRPTLSNQMPAWLRVIACQCLAQNPDDRPTAVQLIYLIHTELNNLASELYAL